ncbi:ABC transporter ATP-binding protein [Planctomycetota bacterium]|nr:ABC transporter ATP-binding protein [Planctomycetota bacterium]
MISLASQISQEPIVTDPIISIRGATKRFGRKAALDGVDVDLPAGSVTGLVGVNGSGKSTLLHALVGLIRLDAGSCRIRDADSANLPPEIKADLGWAPQKPDLLGHLRVRDLLSFTATFYRGWDNSLAADLLHRFELDPLVRAASLSLGQQQRLALVLALAHRPSVLVLDEPAASLDPLARREALAELTRAAADGATILISTHLVSDLARLADRLVILDRGRVRWTGAVDDLLESTKRLRLHRAEGVPVDLVLPGQRHRQTDGAHAQITVHGDVAAAMAIARSAGCDVTVDDLGLEDAVLEVVK